MVSLSSQSRSTRSAASCGMPTAPRLGHNAQVRKGSPGIPCRPRSQSIIRLLAYIMQTQLGTFKDPAETTKPRVESSQPKNKRTTTQLALHASVAAHPPYIQGRRRIALFPSQACPTPTHDTHIPAPHSLVGRGTASILRSRPLGTLCNAPILYSISNLYPNSPNLSQPIRPSAHPRRPIYNNIMPSQAYAMPSGSNAVGFFPSGPSAPHAFATMHTSPRDQHSMYASFGTSSFQVGKSSQVKARNASKSSGKK